MKSWDKAIEVFFAIEHLPLEEQVMLRAAYLRHKLNLPTFTYAEIGRESGEDSGHFKIFGGEHRAGDEAYELTIQDHENSRLQWEEELASEFN